MKESPEACMPERQAVQPKSIFYIFRRRMELELTKGFEPPTL